MADRDTHRAGPRAAALASLAVGATAAGVAAQRRHMRRIAEDPENGRLRNIAPGRPLEARSADGTRLYAEVFGPEEGRSVILAHGWTENLTYWTYVIDDLAARGYRLVAYDLRGHARSDAAVDGDYSPARFGDDLEAVLVASLPEGARATVVGHSLGAMSIAAWAEHHDVEAHACAAALLNTGLGDLIRENLLFPIPKVMQWIKEPLARRTFLGSAASIPRASTPLSHAAIRHIAFGPTATPAQIAFYERMLLESNPDARAAVGLAIADIDLYHALARLTVPTLVMAGADDRLTPPSHARRIAEALPNLSRLIVLPATGHMGPLERPAEVSQALDELIAGVTDASVAAV